MIPFYVLKINPDAEIKDIRYVVVNYHESNDSYLLYRVGVKSFFMVSSSVLSVKYVFDGWVK